MTIIQDEFLILLGTLLKQDITDEQKEELLDAYHNALYDEYLKRRDEVVNDT